MNKVNLCALQLGLEDSIIKKKKLVNLVKLYNQTGSDDGYIHMCVHV